MSVRRVSKRFLGVLNEVIGGREEKEEDRRRQQTIARDPTLSFQTLAPFPSFRHLL